MIDNDELKDFDDAEDDVDDTEEEEDDVDDTEVEERVKLITFKYTHFYPNGKVEKYLVAGRERFGALLFCKDGPAVIQPDGTEEYYSNGKKHRVENWAVINPNGYKEWWLDGKLGRKDGPAIQYSDGGVDWIYDGLYHREDGPAREFADGRKVYYHHGKQINVSTDKEYKRFLKFENFMF